MANLPSSQKNVRKSTRKRVSNRRVLEKIKNSLKTNSGSLSPEAQRMIDKSAKRKVIHKNKAARLKARLAKKTGKKFANG